MIKSSKKYWLSSQYIASNLGCTTVTAFLRLILFKLSTGYGVDIYKTYDLYKGPIDINKWKLYVDKKDFCKILLKYNKKPHISVLEDKLLFAERCIRDGLAHPQIIFTINYSGAASEFTNVDWNDLPQALAGLSNGDYIIKTDSGSYGIDLWLINVNSGSLFAYNTGHNIDPYELSDLLRATGLGYFVQRKAEVSDSLKDFMPGDASGTIRVVTLQSYDGSIITPYVFLKLPVIGSVSDNFGDGSSGNLLALVDRQDLHITRVIRKSASGLMQDLYRHPDTKVAFTNLPSHAIQLAIDFSVDCAKKIPEIRAVGWDIIVTNAGALVLEGNPMFDPIGPQLCIGHGLKYELTKLIGKVQ